MLSRREPKPKWIKHVPTRIGSAHPSGWNVTLYLQFKRSFSFFTFFFIQSAIFPSKIFGTDSTQDDYKMVNESSKSSLLRDFERRTLTATPVTFNITQTRLKLLTTDLWWKPHDPRIITPSTFHLWRCPWCNGYRHRIWTRRYEFNSGTRLIAFHIALIPLGKGRLGSSVLARQLV